MIETNITTKMIFWGAVAVSFGWHVPKYLIIMAYEIVRNI